MYIYGQNITELKEKERAIVEKNKELQKYIESNLELENFAHLASHDLRSPLINVINFSDMLMESAQGKLSGEEQKFLQFITDGAHRMKLFIDKLLDYSIYKNKKVEYENINISELVDGVLLDLTSEIKATGAHIDSVGMPLEVRADRLLITQVFQNLISNALKFRDNGKKPIVRISYENKNRRHKFAVQDNGIGIPAKFQDKIFGIFKRLHLRTEYSGSGIGLSTCKNAIEKHGGKLWLESELGKGSKFMFSIPKVLPASDV